MNLQYRRNNKKEKDKLNRGNDQRKNSANHQKWMNSYGNDGNNDGVQGQKIGSQDQRIEANQFNPQEECQTNTIISGDAQAEEKNTNQQIECVSGIQEEQIKRAQQQQVKQEQVKQEQVKQEQVKQEGKEDQQVQHQMKIRGVQTDFMNDPPSTPSNDSGTSIKILLNHSQIINNVSEENNQAGQINISVNILIQPHQWESDVINKRDIKFGHNYFEENKQKDEEFKFPSPSDISDHISTLEEL
ncbi:unnamed protein product [Paramecium octaurelia]|uniref:Uncharacterized protein n=1 Tax=Paramecium octaurelia TaxID=43137 RepID=A0A8S1XYY6_PAROT|nr:unnamed protein product [Paramecium octaurelia]